MSRKIVQAVQEATGALRDLWTAQTDGDQAAIDGALGRGHRALRPAATDNTQRTN